MGRAKSQRPPVCQDRVEAQMPPRSACVASVNTGMAPGAPRGPQRPSVYPCSQPPKSVTNCPPLRERSMPSGHHQAHDPPGRPSATSPFALTLTMPSDLPRLADITELAPPGHAEVLFRSLPSLPVPDPPAPVSLMELYEALEMLECPLTDPGYKWPPIAKECLDEPDAELLLAASWVTSDEVRARLDVAASRWEANVREEEERRRPFDWSFEPRLYRPCLAIIDALWKEEQRSGHSST